MRVLVLNKNYIPVAFISKYKALGKFLCGRVEGVILHNGNVVSSNWTDWVRQSSIVDMWPEDQEFVMAGSNIAIPRVVRCLFYDKIPRHGIRLNRRAIMQRDDYTCYICGEQHGISGLTIDHIIPKSKGGKPTWTNLATCCKKCNLNKGNKTLSELCLKPQFQIYEPKVSNIEKLKFSKTENCDEWEYFGV